MTPEQLEEIPGIGDKTLEKISLAVRRYFEQLEQSAHGRAPQAEKAEGADPAVTEEEREAVLATDQAETENDAAVITEAENVRAAEDENLTAVEEDPEEYRTAAEAAVEDIPPADEAEVETLEDQPAEALEQDAQSAEEPLLENIETESATTDEQAAKEDGV
jgi:N utilization substance protein A